MQRKFRRYKKKDFYNNLYDFLKNLIKKVNDDKFYPSNLGKNVEEIQKENFDKKVRSNLRAKVIIIVFTVIIILQLFKLLAGLFKY